MKKEILGILGGMGPYASLEFHKKILQYDNASKDWEYTHVIHDNNITIPSRTRHILYGEEDPTAAIIEAINHLAKLNIKAVVLPCNSVHYFYDTVSPYINAPWLNMLEIVGKQIRDRGLKKTLIIGGYVTVNKRTYDDYLTKSFYFDDKENSVVYELIEAVKSNKLELVDRLAIKLISYFDKYIEEYNIDSILLGCTEFSISKRLQAYSGVQMLDSSEIYAEYASRYMKG
jgi:aspartate racemase